MRIDEFNEGKSPHKKGTAKYKAHMAAMHAESDVTEDIASLTDIAAMAAVAGLAAPVMGAMLKAAYKTGKGINAIRKIAQRAGVKLADRVMGEQLDDFNKDEPNKSTVAVPGYGTMNVDSLMKNIIDQTTKMVTQMQQGSQGFRNADYALNSNKVLATKVAALVQALDDLQAIRSKGGARSKNIQQEAEQEQQPLPVDVNSIMNTIQQFESSGNISPQDADLMRRGVQSLTSQRQTVNPQAILQLLTGLVT